MKLSLQDALNRTTAELYGRAIASVHSRANIGDQPLYIAAIGGNTELIRAFLDAGAEIDSERDGEFTPLHHAIEQGKFLAAKRLIARGVDVEKSSILEESAAEMARRVRISDFGAIFVPEETSA